MKNSHNHSKTITRLLYTGLFKKFKIFQTENSYTHSKTITLPHKTLKIFPNHKRDQQTTHTNYPNGNPNTFIRRREIYLTRNISREQKGSISYPNAETSYRVYLHVWLRAFKSLLNYEATLNTCQPPSWR